MAHAKAPRNGPNLENPPRKIKPIGRSDPEGRKLLNIGPMANFSLIHRHPFLMFLVPLYTEETWELVLEEEASNLIKSFLTHTAGSLMNLTEKVFSMTYSVVAKVAVGKKFHGQEEFLSLIKDTMEVAGGFNVADLFPSVKILGSISGLRPRAEKIHRKIDEIFTTIIDEHKARVGEVVDHEDLIDVLLKV
ncbi:cytochrome P450 71D11-like [Cornus florida]|uniref:cytochrome P450 71D11-like n=1 Tax=Cornus florida TaxID=4283 RepID=UPI002899D4B8|nr:cytochrome P450 71D11-like [Cornus florida]